MMKRKIFAPLMGAVVLGLTAYAGYRTYDAYNVAGESDLLLANAEALAQDESGTGCPEPYDVPDHYLGYVQKTGTQTIQLGGYIEIRGKRIPVEGKVGATITFTYEVGDCSNFSEGACCPYDKIGDIKNVNII